MKSRRGVGTIPGPGEEAGAWPGEEAGGRPGGEAGGRPGEEAGGRPWAGVPEEGLGTGWRQDDLCDVGC